jgi:hypothetical protein
MKAIFWNVQIEMYEDGTVKAAVVRSRKAEYLPRSGYLKDHGREVFSLWYETEAAARGAVLEALAMNKGQEAAA